MLGFDQAVESTSGKIAKLLDAHSGGENGSNGWKNWDVHKDPTKKVEDYSNKCIYLTAEADETLETLEPGTMYVIGGVVDRNRLPGVCAERAKKLGIKQKRLPIKENITFLKRSVLTIVHVCEILLAIRNGKSWTEALLSVLPSRVNAVAKRKNLKSTNTDDKPEEEENRIS